MRVSTRSLVDAAIYDVIAKYGPMAVSQIAQLVQHQIPRERRMRAFFIEQCRHGRTGRKSFVPYQDVTDLERQLEIGTKRVVNESVKDLRCRGKIRKASLLAENGKSMWEVIPTEGDGCQTDS